MSTKGKNWKWSNESRENARGSRPASNGNQNGLKHGLSRTPEYNSWKKMMYRCYKESDKHYGDYGGRGIEVCPSWHDVRNFYEDMGQMPKLEGNPRMSIERVDVNGNYEPSNCIWLPIKLQSKNRRPWKHTPEGLASISASKQNIEYRRNSSKARKGKVVSSETKQKISKSLKEFYRTNPLR